MLLAVELRSEHSSIEKMASSGKLGSMTDSVTSTHSVLIVGNAANGSLAPVSLKNTIAGYCQGAAINLSVKTVSGITRSLLRPSTAVVADFSLFQ
jgi:hypothetical protein